MLVAPVSPLAGTLACALGRPGNASPNRAQRGSARWCRPPACPGSAVQADHLRLAAAAAIPASGWW